MQVRGFCDGTLTQRKERSIGYLWEIGPRPRGPLVGDAQKHGDSGFHGISIVVWAATRWREAVCRAVFGISIEAQPEQFTASISARSSGALRFAMSESTSYEIVRSRRETMRRVLRRPGYDRWRRYFLITSSVSLRRNGARRAAFSDSASSSSFAKRSRNSLSA